MSLVFYYSPMSSATPVFWALEELGVPYDKVRIDLKAGEQKTAEFLKINPNGKVPTLVHDGVAIFESLAILLHLGETFGVEKGLFPPPGLKRAEALTWLVWCQVSVGEATSRYLHNVSERVAAELRNPKAADVAKDELHSLLRILDETLRKGAASGTHYLIGDSFSLADLHLASWTEYCGMFGLDLAPYEAIREWSTRCLSRPAHARAMAG